jgi:hypothetical protein
VWSIERPAFDQPQGLLWNKQPFTSPTDVAAMFTWAGLVTTESRVASGN